MDTAGLLPLIVAGRRRSQGGGKIRGDGRPTASDQARIWTLQARGGSYRLLVGDAAEWRGGAGVCPATEAEQVGRRVADG